MGRPAENMRKKRRKKGRPSLLDLQKRSLRLQNPNPNPNPPDPYLRFPAGDDKAEDDDEGAVCKEKKLNLVLRIPESSGSDGEGRRRGRKRRIGDVAAVEKTESEKSKAGDTTKGELPSDVKSGTPLPGRKLLVFILDRLQKKDTYGVFAEPVDPEELPDYQDIIENPMDFGTIRKKLSRGEYANLEQFEKDVFLISLNAMRYNAPDTVYFRQARSIQELAKKDFQNLRQESDEEEPEPKTARRGRPPANSAFKKPVGRPASERATSNNSDALITNAPKSVALSKSSVDAIKNCVGSDEHSLIHSSNKILVLPQTRDNHRWSGYQRSEWNEELPGSMERGVMARYCNKVSISEENCRNTYMHSSVVSSRLEPSILTTFDRERKELVPVGLHIGYAYARSLSRFAAALGPLAWEIAAKQIEKALPPGMKFGRGWIGEQDAPPQSHQTQFLPVSTSSFPCYVKTPSTTSLSADRPSENSGASLISLISKSHPLRTAPSLSSIQSISKKPLSSVDAVRVTSHVMNTENAHDSIQPKVPTQLHDDSFSDSTFQSGNSISGSSTPRGGPLSSPVKPTGSVSKDFPVSRSQLPETASINRSNISICAPSVNNAEVERSRFSSPCAVNSFHSFFHPPERGDQETERMKSQKSGNSVDSIHYLSASLMEADQPQLGKLGATGSRNGFSLPVAANQVDTEKSDDLGKNDSGNNSVHSKYSVVKRVDKAMGRAISSQVDTVKTFIQSAAITQSIKERIETSNSCDLNSEKALSVPSRHAEVGKPKLGNPKMLGLTKNFADRAMMGHETADIGRSDSTNTISSCKKLPESPRDPQWSLRQVTMHKKIDSTPDLNVRFQSPTSPPSGMVVDPQQPDIVLQL